MVQPEKLSAVVDQYRCLLKSGDGDRPGDREIIASTTPDEMNQKIHDIQLQQDTTKTLMNLNRLRLFLRGMEELDKTLVALYGQVGKDAMEYVWGSMRFLLEKTKSTERAFDNVLCVYEQLGVHIPPLSRYMTFFCYEFDESRQCDEFVINIYKDIQEFHAHAYKLFSLHEKLWQRLHRPIWKDLDHTFKKIGDSLVTHANLIKEQGALFQQDDPDSDDQPLNRADSGYLSQRSLTDLEETGLPNYYAAIAGIERKFQEDEEKRKQNQKRKVKGWISSSDKIQEMHKRFRGMSICENSGRWIFRKYSKVAQWVREDERPEAAIWLHGGRGFGKTFLASLVVEELRELKRNGSKIPKDSKIFFFYCQEEDNEQRTYLDILKGILYQMVEQDDYILPLCDDKIAHGGEDSLSSAETAQSLIEVFVDYNSRQYIIIDGLDECDSEDIRQTAEYFMRLVNTCDIKNKQGQLRVMFMSQSMPEMDTFMPKDDASIELNSMDNMDDIRDYVRKRIPEFRKSGSTHGGFNLSAANEEQIEKIILHQSEGMFLYAHLAIEYLLQQQTKDDLLKKIKQEMLPRQLATMYEKLLGSVKARIERRTQEQAWWRTAKLLLGWLVCAKRPLKWHEMQSILSFDPVQGTVDFDGKMLRQNVQEYLGSLVHILIPGGHIRLIHSTARTYIIRNQHISEQEVQCQLASLCLRYLSLSCFVENCDTSERQEKARLGWFSFQDYACSQWHSHIDTVIRKCGDFLVTEASYEVRNDFTSALEGFFIKHGQYIKGESHAELDRSYVDRFRGLACYDHLDVLWKHIFNHQKGSLDDRNSVGISQIDSALDANRNVLEENYTPSSETVNQDTIEDYYGPNLFKCRRTLCRFFHVGYNTKKARENHHNRHTRPFPCPLGCSWAPIGFSNNKDKDRHIRIYHPELSEGPSPFEALNRRQVLGRFSCQICSRSFTRNINLKGHERTHFGDRPYACPTCGKRFTRVNDCRRHEKIHAKKGA